MFVHSKMANIVLAVALIGLGLGTATAAEKQVEKQTKPALALKDYVSFTPPSVESIPHNKHGDLVRYGLSLFKNTQQLRGKYVGNALNCADCHVDNGRRANSAPLWGTHAVYPIYGKKNGRVNSIEDRIRGCFAFSMNGTPPPMGSKVLRALVAYSDWLATGAPASKPLPGRGYPELSKPEQGLSISRGKSLYAHNCAICHGTNGEGTQVNGKYAFPPLWGKDSYNWGGGMHRISIAASFIKANMPLSKPNSLSDQQAWDIAAFMNSHERPQDPRFDGNIAKTASTHHQHDCYYGVKINGKVLGKGSH